MHYLELDQFVGENFLVTVHGPLSPEVPLESALRETEAVAARLEGGRLHATSPFGLTYAIVSSIARRESELVAQIAREVGLMEQQVMAEVDEEMTIAAERLAVIAAITLPITSLFLSSG